MRPSQSAGRGGLRGWHEAREVGAVEPVGRPVEHPVQLVEGEARQDGSGSWASIERDCSAAWSWAARVAVMPVTSRSSRSRPRPASARMASNRSGDHVEEHGPRPQHPCPRGRSGRPSPGSYPPPRAMSSSGVLPRPQRATQRSTASTEAPLGIVGGEVYRQPLVDRRHRRRRHPQPQRRLSRWRRGRRQ